MGPELGTLYFELWQELAWLHLKWQLLQELFGAGRVRFLNSIAPLFFDVVQRTFVDDIILHLARMTDPPTSPGKRGGETKENLTVLKFPEFVTDDAFRAEVADLLGSIDRSCKFARDWRNRRLAHTDLPTYRKTHAKPLPEVRRRNIGTALSDLTHLIQRFSEHYRNSDARFDFEVLPPIEGGAHALVVYLDLGVQYEKLRREASFAQGLGWRP
jgi:hypothetical protein